MQHGLAYDYSERFVHLHACCQSLFTGKERDTESGNDYFGARYYSSAMGRFMSPDWSGGPVPIPYVNLGDPQTLNLYEYVRNNPLGIDDADGHGWWADFLRGLSNATWRPLVSMAEHPILTGRQIGFAATHPKTMFTGVKAGVSATANGVIHGDGEAIGVVVGTVLMTVIPGVGEGGDAADVASDLSKIGEAAEDSGSLLDLNKSLASQEQMGQLAAGEGRPIAGAGTGTALRDADRLASQYGGQPGDWQKVASGNYNPGGAKGGGFETHAYQNSKTGQVVEMKSKMQ
jgi:RHS repeat-associated protein